MKTSSPEEKAVITAQIPEPLLEDLRAIAKAEGRSLSGQIRLFLAEAVTRKNTAGTPDQSGHLAAA